MSMLYFLDRPEAMTFPGINVEPSIKPLIAFSMKRVFSLSKDVRELGWEKKLR